MRIKDAKKVVFVRVGALGDLLVGLAAFVETLALFPNADVYLVGNSLWLEIIEAGFFPQLKGLFIVENNKSTAGYLFHPETQRWVKASEEKLPLKTFLKDAQGFVNTRLDSLRYAWPALFAGVEQRFGSAPWPFHLLYTHSAPWLGKDPLIHERDAALRLLDSSTKVGKMDLIRKWQTQGGLPKTKNYKPVPWRNYFLINPTASRTVKAWPQEKFRELLERLLPQSGNLTPKLIGSPKETEWLKFVANGKAEIIQPGSISELMDVVASAKFLITNTSSMQFIAASTQTPTLTLMGNARPEIWGPLGKNDKMIMGKLNDQKKFLDQDAKEVAAFKSISVDQVQQIVRSFF